MGIEDARPFTQAPTPADEEIQCTKTDPEKFKALQEQLQRLTQYHGCGKLPLDGTILLPSGMTDYC